MATRNNSRSMRPRGRAGGNHPRTHPNQPPKPSPRAAAAAKPTLASASPFDRESAFAKDLRRRLNLIHAIVMTVAIALESENAEHDHEFAAVLTRCAADPLWGVIVDHLGGEDDDDSETGP